MTENDPQTITITLDDGWLADIENYNTYGRKAIQANIDGESERVIKKAGKAYANASMSLGWKLARELCRQGVEIES